MLVVGFISDAKQLSITLTALSLLLGLERASDKAYGYTMQS